MSRPIVEVDWAGPLFLTRDPAGSTRWRFIDQCATVLSPQAADVLEEITSAASRAEVARAPEEVVLKLNQMREAAVARFRENTRAAIPRVLPVRGASDASTIACHLRSDLYAVVDAFLPLRSADTLREWVVRLRSHGELSAAQTVSSHRSAGRGDLMTFVDLYDDARLQPQEGLRGFLFALDALVLRLQSILGGREELGGCTLKRRKCQATCYPAGSQGYMRHVDDSQGSRRRLLTAILYLNPGWSDSRAKQTAADVSAGALRVYPKSRSDDTWGSPNSDDDWRGFDIVPHHNRLALFWSDQRVPHEVLPLGRADRLAVSIWYGDAMAMR